MSFDKGGRGNRGGRGRDKRDSFGGGDGRLGLHGTDQPATLGSDVTNGCIRVHNEAITQLAAAVPLGTPLTIHP